MNPLRQIAALFKTKGIQSVPNQNAGWFSVVNESFGGAWQSGVEVSKTDMLAHGAVFSCVSLIASDIGKLPISITQNSNGIWLAIDTDYSRLFRKPNGHQNRAQFFNAWIVSKLLHGNSYILKVRDAAGRIIGLKLLDPTKVQVLIGEDDAVFYQVSGGTGLQTGGEVVTIPAREVIHDRGVCLHHPLIGVSPLTAAALAAGQGLSIQKSSSKFFANSSRPGGILLAPGVLAPEQAAKIKNHFETNYTGENSGRTAILTEGMTFSGMAISAADSQLLEQLQFTDQQVCNAFGVPAWKVGIGDMPNYAGSEASQLDYYRTVIQNLLESLELCLDEGLELPITQRTEFDTNELLRLDTATRFDSYAKAIGAGWMAPNEARRREGLAPVEGGDSPLIQQQNYSLAALARRDASEVPQ